MQIRIVIYMVRVFNDTFIQLYRCGKLNKILVEKIGVLRAPTCRKSLANFITFAIYNLTAFLVGTLRHQTLSQGPQAYCRSSASTIPWCAKSLHALLFLTTCHYNENENINLILLFVYSETCLIRHTKGPGKCVGLYRMSEYSGFTLVNRHTLGL